MAASFRSRFFVSSCLTFAVAACALAQPIRHRPDRDPVIGVNIWSVHARPQGEGAWSTQMNAIRAHGFGGVTILPQSFVDLQTGAVTPQDPTPQPRFGGMTDAELAVAIRRAKALGMTVTVSPTIEPANRTLFRGEISFNDPPPDEPNTGKRADNGVDTPENHARFWQTYQARIVQLAAIAQAEGADRFNIGAELPWLDTDPRNAEHWARLIDAADAVFLGRLGYTTVHWTFDRDATVRMIWSNPKIDYISISSYFAVATPEQCARSGAEGDPAFVGLVAENFSKQLEDRVLPVAKRLGKRVILNEVGFTPYEGTGAAPWDWTLGERAPYDGIEARNALEGVFRAVAGRGEHIEAVHLWCWGWPGGFAGERFYIHPLPVDLPQTPNFDESHTRPMNLLIREYLSKPDE